MTGISGYVGGMLAPALAARGHAVRGFARDPSRVEADVPVVRGDLNTGEGLDEALAGVEVAYYLVHSMEGNADFTGQERRSAERFAAAAAKAGVRRIVYMSVLTPAGGEQSEHVRSRLAVERALAAQVPEVVVLRASIVIGARSRSFVFLLRLVQRFPLLVLPPWRGNRTAPIDERDLRDALLAAATAPVDGGLVVHDAVGPDVLTYEELTQRISDALLVSRPTVPFPVSATAITAPIAAAVSGEDLGLVAPLMESLGEDLLPREPDPHEVDLPLARHGIEAAIAHALAHSDLGDEED